MIIAFSGKRGTGKTTAANYLGNYGFKKVSFSDKLKEISKLLFPFTMQELIGDKKETLFLTYDWTPREFMIKLGAFLRYWDKAYWIKAAIPLTGKKTDIAVDDVRFVNEINYLKDLGAKTIRINRYASLNPYKTEINDPSETELDNYKDFDYVINEIENRDLDNLYKKLDRIMEELKREPR